MSALDRLLVVGTSTAERAAIASALSDAGFEVSSHADGEALSARRGPSEIVVAVSATAPVGAPNAIGYLTLSAAMGRAEPLLDLPPERATRSRLGFVLAGAVMALWERRVATFVALAATPNEVESAESFCRAVLAAPRDCPLVGPFVTYRISPDRSEVHTRGASLLGLPEAATAAVPRTDEGVERAERALAALLLLWASPIAPAGDADLPRRYGVMELSSGVRWLTDQTLDVNSEAGEESAHARYQFFFRTLATAGFVGAVAGVDAWLAGPPRFHVARIAWQSGLIAYLTNGLGAKSQAGGSEEGENDRVELCAIAPCEVPNLPDVLARLGSIVHAPGSAPLRPWDRCAVACPPNVDIAGVVLRKLTAFQVDRGCRVHVWDALPITHDELARFRADPAAQGQWIDARFEREDYAEIHARWRALAATI